MRTHWEEFSTRAVLPAQRVYRWNDYGSETLCNLTVDPCDRECFDATLARIGFGPMGLVRMTSTGATAHGGMGGVGGWAAPEKDALLIILSEAGRSQFVQDHRTVELAPGDLLIRDLAKSWAHTGQGEMRMLMVKIPYTALLTRVDDPARLLGTSLSSNRPAVALAADVIRAIDRTLTAEPDAAWSATLAELMLDSVTMIYQSMPDLAAWQPGWQQRAGFRRDAKAFILRHLDDPELSVATIAAALGVGQRRLQRAFVEAGETPSQFILAQRLDRAAALLCKAKGPCRNSILDIALSVGFNDASHFSRTFSRRFGVSPRRYCGTPPLV